MTHRLRGLVAWSGVLALVLVACGNTSPAGPAGGGGAVATGGAAADSGGSSTGSSSSGGGHSSTGGAPSTGGVVGTGGAVPTAPPNPDLVAPTTVADLCASLPYDRGDLMARCYGGEAADWAGSWEHHCDGLSASEADGRLVLNQDRVDACYALLAAGVCDTGFGCADLTVGTVPVGEACTMLYVADECDPEAYCSQSGDCGLCKPRGTVGEQCAGQFVDLLCGAGLACNGASCAPIAQEGEPCSEPNSTCAAGLDCDADPQVGGEGVCRTFEPPRCMNDGECEPGFQCQPSQAGGDGTCLPVPDKKVGEACTFGLGECAGYCSLEGVCEALAHEGEPCGALEDETGELSEYISCSLGSFCGAGSDPTGWACLPQLPPEQNCE